MRTSDRFGPICLLQRATPTCNRNTSQGPLETQVITLFSAAGSSTLPSNLFMGQKICGKPSTTWINCEPWNSLENIIYMCPFHYVVHHTSIFSTSCLQIHVAWAARKNSGIFQCTLSGLPYPHLRATLLGTLSPTSTLAHRLVVIY